MEGNLIPGLVNDLAKQCLARVPREDMQSIACVCRLWREWVQSKELFIERKHVGTSEEWLYQLSMDKNGKWSTWQVFNPQRNTWHALPPVPGPPRMAFGHVVVDGKLVLMAGLVQEDDCSVASSEVFQYEEALNRWIKLPNMNVPRYEFACANVGGLVYTVGGRGNNGELSSVEVYNPKTRKWALIASLRSPRWGCFACEFDGMLYVLGGRSRFSIGYARKIDLYNPKSGYWETVKSGCTMVVANAVLNNKLFCMEWKNEREVAVFDAAKRTWTRFPVPFTRSLNVEFCFGSLQGKLFLFSAERVPYYKTLVFDPTAEAKCQWHSTNITPLGPCVCCVTITL